MKKSLVFASLIVVAMVTRSRTQAGGSTETIITGIGGGSGDIKPTTPDYHGGGSGGITASPHRNSDLNPVPFEGYDGWASTTGHDEISGVCFFN